MNFKKGDKVETDFKPVEKTTSAPKHYTVETLNNYLKNPFREDKLQANDQENDDEDYKAIFEGLELGTEATRTGIIENAKNSEYIALNKDVYSILPKGIYLIERIIYLNDIDALKYILSTDANIIIPKLMEQPIKFNNKQGQMPLKSE